MRGSGVRESAAAAVEGMPVLYPLPASVAPLRLPFGAISLGSAHAPPAHRCPIVQSRSVAHSFRHCKSAAQTSGASQSELKWQTTSARSWQTATVLSAGSTVWTTHRWPEGQSRLEVHSAWQSPNEQIKALGHSLLSLHFVGAGEGAPPTAPPPLPLAPADAPPLPEVPPVAPPVVPWRLESVAVPPQAESNTTHTTYRRARAGVSADGMFGPTAITETHRGRTSGPYNR